MCLFLFLKALLPSNKSHMVPFPVFESSFTQQQKPYGFNKNDVIYFANL
jgi:hypothetical protein